MLELGPSSLEAAHHLDLRIIFLILIFLLDLVIFFGDL